MRPEIWGKHMWNAIGSIALSYPEEPTIKEQQNVMGFLNSLQNVLPCEKCREHYKENLEKFPLSEALLSRETFIKWIIDVRNSINETNGKKILSYEEGKYQIRKNLFGREITKTHIMFGMLGAIGIFWILKTKTKFLKNLLK